MRLYIGVLLMLNVLIANDAITLEKAIQKVKQHNIELSIAHFNEHIKAYEHKIAQGNAYGSLDLSQTALRSNDALSVFGFKLQSREARFADFGFKQFDGVNDTIAPTDLNYPQDRNHFQTTLAYTLPLYSGGKIEHYTQITKALQTLSALEKEELLAQKIFELKKSFYAISLLDVYLKHLKTMAHNTASLEKTTHAMFEEGYVKHVDVLEVQVRLSDIERQITQAQANQTLLYHFVSFLINEPITSIEGSYEDAMTMIDVEENDTQTIEIQKAQKGVEISQMNMALHESHFLPHIDAFAQYGSGSDSLFKDFSKNDAYTVGIQLRWNLFKGGSDTYNLEKARVENLKAQQQLLLAQKSVDLHVKQMQTQIHNYDAHIQSLKKEVDLAHRIYENYAGRYAQKLVSINDVMMKQSAELAKILSLKEVQNARNETIFALEKLIHKETK